MTNTHVYMRLSVSKERLHQMVSFLWLTGASPNGPHGCKGRVLHPADTDVGQRRGLRGLGRLDCGVTVGNREDKWVL